MSSLSFQLLKALPSLSPPKLTTKTLVCCAVKLPFDSKRKRTSTNGSRPQETSSSLGTNRNLLIPFGLLATVAEPAIAVTGVNYEPDLVSVLIKVGVVAFVYFLIMPPIIMNWLRIRWYRRNLLEMYFQFMFVFIFFPGVLLWAPFLNFRKFPRDPSMKYPWSKPENPSEVRGGFLKYPWASIEDYE